MENYFNPKTSALINKNNHVMIVLCEVSVIYINQYKESGDNCIMCVIYIKGEDNER